MIDDYNNNSNNDAFKREASKARRERGSVLSNHDFYEKQVIPFFLSETSDTLWVSKQASPQGCQCIRFFFFSFWRHLHIDLIGILLSVELNTPFMKFFFFHDEKNREKKRYSSWWKWGYKESRFFYLIKSLRVHMVEGIKIWFVSYWQ